MKISDLIQILARAQAKYGDLPITVDNYSEGLSSEEVYLVHFFKSEYGDEHVSIQECVGSKEHVIK